MFIMLSVSLNHVYMFVFVCCLLFFFSFHPNQTKKGLKAHQSNSADNNYIQLSVEIKGRIYFTLHSRHIMINIFKL